MFFARILKHFIMHIFIYVLLIFNNSLNMVKMDRNMSDLWKIARKKFIFNLGAFFGFILWIVPYKFMCRPAIFTRDWNSFRATIFKPCNLKENYWKDTTGSHSENGAVIYISMKVHSRIPTQNQSWGICCFYKNNCWI